MSGRYAAPTDLDGVLAALAEGYRPVAGGTDLVVGARQGKWALPDDIVAIHRVAALQGISDASEGVRIGAATNHAALVDDDRIRERWTALSDAAAIVGSPATRANGTIGGNIANASPAAETVGPLLCFDAVVELRSSGGARTSAVADLAVGPGRVAAEPTELITAVVLPGLTGAVGSCYVRLEFRRQMEIAVVGGTAVVVLDGDRVAEVRIAITALAPTVRRVAAAEAALVGTDGGRAAAEAAGRAAAEAASPISDVRASADYRRAMAAVVVRRAVNGAVARARGEAVTIPASASLFGAA